MAKILDEMDELYDKIHGYRVDIASHNRNKIEKRANAWKDATGIADEKKDYVRSEVADIQEKIDYCEAEIELAYNKIKVMCFRLENGDE